MRQTTPAQIEALIDDAVFSTLGEPCEVDGQPARCIYAPEDASVPGTELARRSDRVLQLAFRESAGLTLSRGTRVVFREQTYLVDGTPNTAGKLVTVVTLA